MAAAANNNNNNNMSSPKAPKMEAVTRTKKYGYVEHTIKNNLGNNPAEQTQPSIEEATREIVKDYRRHPLIPIYIIQCHGSYESQVRIHRDDTEEGTMTLEWARNSNNLIKMAGVGQWIIHNAPIGTTASCTRYEDSFVDEIGAYFSERRTSILSDNPDRLFNIVSEETPSIPRDTGFVPPTGLYADKEHQPWDNDTEWGWRMVVLPLFQPTDVELLKRNLYFRFVDNRHNGPIEGPDGLENGNNKSREDMIRRIVNRRILGHDEFWKAGPENIYWPRSAGDNPTSKKVVSKYLSQSEVNKIRKQYKILTDLWEDSVPHFIGGNMIPWWKEHGGKTVKMSKMMDIMGRGIFISLTCSPSFINIRNIAEPEYTDQQCIQQGADDYIRRILHDSYYRWNSIFAKPSKYEMRELHPIPLQCEVDTAILDKPYSLVGSKWPGKTRKSKGPLVKGLSRKKNKRPKRKNKRTKKKT